MAATTPDRPFSLDDRYTLESGSVFLTGVQALVRLPLDVHRDDQRNGLRTATLISGYPGSPLGGYDLELQRRRALLDAHDVVHRMGVNEELAATSVMGSQLAQSLPGPRFDGVVGFWYGKANGFDRAMDSLRQANLCGTTRTGGAVALVGDDPTAKSSPTPGASEHAAAALLMPLLYPGDVQEVLDLGRHAVALSRSTGLWTALKMTTSVADGSGSALVDPDRVRPIMVVAELDGRPYEHVPSAHLYGQSVLGMERSMVDARVQAALAYARANGLNEITVRGASDRIGIVAAGKTYFQLRDALRQLDLEERDLQRLGLRLLQLRMPYPLDGEIVRDFASGLDEILVLEDKRPFIELFVKDALYGSADRPLVVGHQDADGTPLVPMHDELEVEAIAGIIARRIGRLPGAPSFDEQIARLGRGAGLTPLPVARSPYFCSGCPHSSSVANVPEGAVVGGGTGCHVLAVFMPQEQVGNVIGITAMGNEGAQWIGASPFTELPHLIQNIGDGTYAHSGILAIRAAVSAGVNITYKLLHNDHVAMTGAQPAIGGLTVRDVVTELIAEGVRRVIVTADEPERYDGITLPDGVDLWHRDRMVEAQEVLAEVPGVTAIVHDQECAAEKRRKRKRGELPTLPERVMINERVCEGCGDCGVASNCLSVQPVETEFGRKTQIHQASCNQDMTCLKGNCPSFMTVVPEGATPAGTAVPEIAAESLPEPQPSVPAAEFTMRITGIGGTGVVTVAQTLAVAAMIEHRFIRGLDQTGLAQKGGPVVSDLRISSEPVDQANRAVAGTCDLYLACDLLVGGQTANLKVADADRTVAIASTAQVPTGHMVVDPTLRAPDGERLVRRLLARAREDASAVFDAHAACEALFGTDQQANIMLVGAAYQAGALPLAGASIEQALRINGAAVETNIQAFRRGRQAFADPEGLQEALAATRPVGSGFSPSTKALSIAAGVSTAGDARLAELVSRRVDELIGYQSAAYARRYAATVERVREAEERRGLGNALTAAVAFHLHKLMAYKDEYEVARLHLDATLHRGLRAQYGDRVRLRFLLQPPVLKALGMDRKIAVRGRLAVGLFRGLTAMRRLRGTKLDPFGRDEIRRVERALVAEYEALIDEIVARLNAENHGVCVALAELPDVVRGYDEVKLRNVATYRDRLLELRGQLDGVSWRSDRPFELGVARG